MTAPAAQPLPALPLALAAGALAGLALPPWGCPPLLWLALVPLWPLASRGLRLPLLLWGLAAVLVSHRWLLWLHPLDWIGVPLPLSLPLCLLLWFGCGLLGGLLVLGWGLLLQRLGPARFWSAVLAAAVWGLAEGLLARGPLFWVGLGASALPGDRALAGLASLGGAGLIALVQLLISWCLWRSLPGASASARRALGLGLGLVLLGHAAGLAALALTPPEQAEPERLLVVQPAIPTRQKFQPAQQQRLLAQLAAALERLTPARPTAATAGLSASARPGAPASPPPQGTAGPGAGAAAASPVPAALAAMDPPGVDGVPADMAPSGGGGAGVSALLLPEGALALGQPLPLPPPLEVLSGGFRWQGESLRSSLLRFAPGDRRPGAWLDKHRLVPLGEWVPLAGLWRWSGLSAVGGVEPGSAGRLLHRPAGPVAVAICYELADGQALAQATRAGAGWLLAAANLDPYPALLQGQYRALAQLRAIETGRWLVSAANTGPSLLVDPRGQVRAALPSGMAASGELVLHPRHSLTAYDRWGETPLVLLLLLAGWRRLRASSWLPAGGERC
ncbi:MAG: nitrilase-related carbon-nitrogen hydrolase [Synechococcaceae cyanobacterium]|nr:nitrilase-related carbon-nitrogen hydrolase [Synechococcaceae cyanobacterium]